MSEGERAERLVFPSLEPLIERRESKMLSDTGLTRALRQAARKAGLAEDYKPTTHGTARSSFRVWAAETGVPFVLAEHCLAHSQKKVEAAYQRSDLLEQRRKVMEDWADHLVGA